MAEKKIITPLIITRNKPDEEPTEIEIFDSEANVTVLTLGPEAEEQLLDALLQRGTKEKRLSVPLAKTIKAQGVRGLRYDQNIFGFEFVTSPGSTIAISFHATLIPILRKCLAEAENPPQPPQPH